MQSAPWQTAAALSLLVQERGLQCFGFCLLGFSLCRSSYRSVGCNLVGDANDVHLHRRSSYRSVGCNFEGDKKLRVETGRSSYRSVGCNARRG